MVLVKALFIFINNIIIKFNLIQFNFAIYIFKFHLLIKL
jgi:hypothetical protein